MKRILQVRSKIILIVILLLAIPSVALAQDSGSGGSPTGCNPAAQRIVAQFDVTCEEVLEQVNNGYGFGEIIKALYITRGGFNYEGGWQGLLAAQGESGIGWGQYKMALRFGIDDASASQLLSWKLAGHGWGQIRKAIAIAGVSDRVSVDDVLGMMESGMEWEAIRDELGLPPGKPPWAGNGKIKFGKFPPGWAAANEKFKGEKRTGPPDWANNDKNSSEEQSP